MAIVLINFLLAKPIFLSYFLSLQSLMRNLGLRFNLCFLLNFGNCPRFFAVAVLRP
jgi:hypothetical protein